MKNRFEDIADGKTLARTSATILNRMAARGREIAIDEVDDSMIIRETFVRRSIQFRKVTPGMPVRLQESSVGSIAEFMKAQETGDTRISRGKRGVPISTSYAARQEGAQPRTKRVAAARRVSKIRLRNRKYRAANRKQRNAIAVHMAAKQSRKFVYLDLGRRKAIFRVEGSRDNPQIKMVHDLSKRSVRVPRNPWMRRTQARVFREAPRIATGVYRFMLHKMTRR